MKNDLIDASKNCDGTYNGVKLLAGLSGLSEEEIRWTWNRMKELKGTMPETELKAQLAREAKALFGKGTP